MNHDLSDLIKEFSSLERTTIWRIFYFYENSKNGCDICNQRSKLLTNKQKIGLIAEMVMAVDHNNNNNDGHL